MKNIVKAVSRGILGVPIKKQSSLAAQFVIVAGTSLLVLFSGDGVNELSDITEVQYATAIIGAMVAVAKDMHSWRQPPQ